MRRLRTVPLILILGSAWMPPAAAQIVGRPQYERVGLADPFLGNGSMPGASVGAELRQIDRRIDRARDNGLITRREARQMRSQARGIAYLAGVYRHDGLSYSERIELRTRIDVLRDSINRHPPANPARRSRDQDGGR